MNNDGLFSKKWIQWNELMTGNTRFRKFLREKGQRIRKAKKDEKRKEKSENSQGSSKAGLGEKIKG